MRLAGYAHASTGTNGHAVNGAAGKLDQRHGDSAVSSSKAGDQDDVILSGNLEQLSQHLQSATAMFNSQSAPATSRGPPYSNLGENGHPHHAGGDLCSCLVIFLQHVSEGSLSCGVVMIQ